MKPALRLFVLQLRVCVHVRMRSTALSFASATPFFVQVDLQQKLDELMQDTAAAKHKPFRFTSLDEALSSGPYPTYIAPPAVAVPLDPGLGDTAHQRPAEPIGDSCTTGLNDYLRRPTALKSTVPDPSSPLLSPGLQCHPSPVLPSRCRLGCHFVPFFILGDSPSPCVFGKGARAV